MKIARRSFFGCFAALPLVCVATPMPAKAEGVIMVFKHRLTKAQRRHVIAAIEKIHRTPYGVKDAIIDDYPGMVK